MPRISAYITALSNNMDNIDEGEFDRYYTKYCNYKHGNMLAPYATEMAGDVDDDVLKIILTVRMYLDRSTSNNKLIKYYWNDSKSK